MISDKNTRTLITIPKELKETLTEFAKNDGRSFNNLVIYILENYVKSIQAKSSLTDKSGNAF